MCAILGIVSSNRDVIGDGIVLLGAQNHRGQQSCGAVVSGGKRLRSHFGRGFVSEVFGERDRPRWSKLKGSMCVMHTLYSTIEDKRSKTQPSTQQPILFEFDGKMGALSHNGNLNRLSRLRGAARRQGYVFKSASSDSEVIAALIATSKKPTFWEALVETLKKIEGKGSFSLVILYDGKLYGVRDQNGNRPLCIIKMSGKNGESDSYILSSESCVFTCLQATRVMRDIHAGELLVVGPNGVERSFAWTKKVKLAMCANELVYFASPASRICGCSVYAFRLCAGRMLARKHPIKADIISSIPNAGRGVADGAAQESGIPNLQSLIKQNHIRTFLMHRHVNRADRQRLSLQAIPDVAEGKSVWLGEDSVFRSSVGRMAIKMVREHGKAREVHMGVGSPPICYGCHMGIDIATRAELIAPGRTFGEIQQHLGADSLEYLTLEEFRQVFREMGLNPDDFCMGCYTGVYPVPPPR